METINKKQIAALFFILLACISFSCKKPPGPGGRATVKGRVLAKDFNNTNSYLLAEYYVPGENVYICYGSSDNVGNDVKTAADGSFQFRFLNKGHYRVFVTSADTSIHVKGADKELPVQVEFDITGISQTIDLGDLKINK